MFDQNFIAPTPPAGDNSNQIATTAFVQTAITSTILADNNIWTGTNAWAIASTIASATAATLDDLKVSAAITTITGNTGSPITRLSKMSFYQPTITDTSAVTVTDAATLYIDNSPLAAGSVTITRPWGMLINNGAHAWLTGHALIGPIMPADWFSGTPSGASGPQPTDGLAVNTTVPGSGAGGIMSACTFLATSGTQEDILISGTIGAGVAAVTHIGLQCFDVTLAGGSSLTNSYGIHVGAITAGGTTNQGLWIEALKNGIGTSNAQTQLHINKNTTQNIAPSVASTNMLITPIDASGATIEMHGYGGAFAYPIIVTRFNANTGSSPQTVPSGQVMFNFQMMGYDGSAYAVSAGFQPIAAETWGGSAHGTHIDLLNTPAGSTTLTRALRIQASGGLSVGATTDPGIGAILANTDLYSNNASFLIRTKATLSNGAAAQAGTLTNAPSAGNPTKWISIDDNGTTRKIPAW